MAQNPMLYHQQTADQVSFTFQRTIAL